jgi:hypothetical protein
VHSAFIELNEVPLFASTHSYVFSTFDTNPSQESTDFKRLLKEVCFEQIQAELEMTTEQMKSNVHGHTYVRRTLNYLSHQPSADPEKEFSPLDQPLAEEVRSVSRELMMDTKQEQSSETTLCC